MGPRPKEMSHSGFPNVVGKRVQTNPTGHASSLLRASHYCKLKVAIDVDTDIDTNPELPFGGASESSLAS